jgi:cytochrome c oxidase subunit II
VSAVAGTPPGQAPGPRHARRIATIWIVATAIVVPLVIWVLGPHIPPYNNSQQASDQHTVNVVLTALAAPVLLFIWTYFAYAMFNFRHRSDEPLLDGPPLEGNPRVQLIWLAITSAVVLGLAVYGTTDLLTKAGAGGGQGPNPLAKPSASALRNALQVQVIGQQWLWTFRYPGYGGVETPYLVIPVNRQIVFHVTSLDVAHSFWAIELAVKADAIPGNDNVAYLTATKIRTFQIRCAELCGLWHGHMNTSGRVVSQGGFATWIAQQRISYRGVTKQLPPYSHVYYPLPIRRAG